MGIERFLYNQSMYVLPSGTPLRVVRGIGLTTLRPKAWFIPAQGNAPYALTCSEEYLLRL